MLGMRDTNMLYLGLKMTEISRYKQRHPRGTIQGVLSTPVLKAFRRWQMKLNPSTL
jgi:hypothetical protein